jgi:hypothetical protein
MTAPVSPTLPASSIPQWCRLALNNKSAALFSALQVRSSRSSAVSAPQYRCRQRFLPERPRPVGLAPDPAGTNTAGVIFSGGKILVRSNMVPATSVSITAAPPLAKRHRRTVAKRASATEVPLSSSNSVSPNLVASSQTAIDGDYEFWYELVGFTAGSAFGEGADLINGTIAALGDPTITDLTGLFVTKAAGVAGSNVSTGAKLGNACSPAVQ